jgi:hypothetical protein
LRCVPGVVTRRGRVWLDPHAGSALCEHELYSVLIVLFMVLLTMLIFLDLGGRV